MYDLLYYCKTWTSNNWRRRQDQLFSPALFLCPVRCSYTYCIYIQTVGIDLPMYVILHHIYESIFHTCISYYEYEWIKCLSSILSGHCWPPPTVVRAYVARPLFHSLVSRHVVLYGHTYADHNYQYASFLMPPHHTRFAMNSIDRCYVAPTTRALVHTAVSLISSVEKFRREQAQPNRCKHRVFAQIGTAGLRPAKKQLVLAWTRS